MQFFLLFAINLTGIEEEKDVHIENKNNPKAHFFLFLHEKINHALETDGKLIQYINIQ